MLGELPKGKPQNLLPLIIRAIEIKKPLAIYGTDYPTEDGTCLRDYVHVTDLAQAHIAALRATSPGYDVFNVGTGKPTSVLGLINTFETVNNVKVPYEKAARRPGDPAICYALPNKINKNLGWSAHKTVEDAVRDAWKWHQSLKTV
jgi:UDP-glucose 4-epimerase